LRAAGNAFSQRALERLNLLCLSESDLVTVYRYFCWERTAGFVRKGITRGGTWKLRPDKLKMGNEKQSFQNVINHGNDKMFD